MRNFSTWAIAAVVCALATSSIGIGSASAADIPTPPPSPPQYGDVPEYYPPPAEQYVYRRPVAPYGYPPAAVYEEYGPPAVVVVPEAYYPRRPYVYGGPIYGERVYQPYVARGPGRYAGRWNHGHRRW